MIHVRYALAEGVASCHTRGMTRTGNRVQDLIARADELAANAMTFEQATEIIRRVHDRMQGGR